MLFAFGPNPETERRVDESFRAFWERYPCKVGKLKAQKAYAKARLQASEQEILDGVERYIKNKPDWQCWAHPSSWLNAGRWMDFEGYVQPQGKQPCPHTPACYNVWACLVLTAREKGEVV